jgi:hypothetical protein
MSHPMPFALTDAERASPLWERLMRHFEDSIARIQRENENEQLDVAQTALKRGEIKAIRRLMLLDRPPRSEELPPGA